MAHSTSPASRWSSGPAFYIASIGAAVGLGSVWRLPYQVGSNGGSAFILVFTLGNSTDAFLLLRAQQFGVSIALLPAIWVVLILRVVDAFRMIELVFMMTKGGPAGYTEVLPWYLYTTGFLSLDLGYAAAMAVLMLILVTIVSQLFVRRLAYRET